MDKKEALAEYFGIPVEKVTKGYDENHFEAEDGEGYYLGEFLVVDEDTARELAEEDVKNFIDDLGIMGFTTEFQDYIIRNEMLDTDWFDEDQDEDIDNYVSDITDEDSDEFENRMVEEAYERGLIDEEDLVEDEEGKRVLADGVDMYDIQERLKQLLKYDYGDPVKWFRDNFGDRELSDVVNKYNLLDEDAVAKDAVDEDGIAHFLAHYDGKEIELKDGLYAYRTN